ncbi:MAG: DUF4440 domain-containing protein [Gemmataceae bacterium]|nr:DUF4440 domain-containing protein [Gemmataceae bacterium]
MRPLALRTCALLTLLAVPLTGMPRAWADDGSDIVKLVQDSQRAGIERHEFDGYITIWAADAKLVYSRAETASVYDTIWSRAQLEATVRTKCRAERPKDVKLTYENVRTEVAGDRAVLRCRTTKRAAEGTSIADEVFQLRRTDAGWKVFENRFWLIEWRDGDRGHDRRQMDEADRSCLAKS